MEGLDTDLWISDAEVQLFHFKACLCRWTQSKRGCISKRTFASVTSSAYMNYFASVSFDLLNHSSRQWTTPFKVFLQIIKCNVPIISISHPARNSLELKTGISSSEILVLILKQPEELNDVDVSLASSKAKVNCGEQVTCRGKGPQKYGRALIHICWRTSWCPRTASQACYSIANPQWLHCLRGIFPDWYLLSLTWESAPFTLYEKPGKIIPPCLPFYENGAKHGTQTFNLPPEIKRLHLLAQKINTCDLIWAFIFT